MLGLSALYHISGVKFVLKDAVYGGVSPVAGGLQPVAVPVIFTVHLFVF